MDIQPTYIVYAIVAVTGLLGLAYLVGKLGRFGLVVLGIIVVGIFGLAMGQQSAATRRAAEAAEVAAVGQTASNVGLTLALGVMLVLLLFAISLNLWQARKLRDIRQGKWTSGPNALWARTGGDPSMPVTTGTEMWVGLMMGQYMALQQMLTNLYAGAGISHQRRQRTSWGVRQDSSPLPFPSTAGGWEEWDDEAPWDLVETQGEEELWDVLS